MKNNFDADLICIGGGLGGLAAAVSASRLGLSTLILEKSSWIGGGASYSGGLCWIPGQGSDSIENAKTYIAHVQGERHYDGELLSHVLTSMSESVAAYIDSGVALEVVPNNPDVYFPAAPGSVSSGRMWECSEYRNSLNNWSDQLMPSPHYRIGLRHSELFGRSWDTEELEALWTKRANERLLTMGPGLVGSFARVALVEHSVRCITDTQAVGLVLEGTRVVGVRTMDTSGERKWLARKGVLIATGGYGWSANARDLEGMPDLVEAGPPSISGDHLSLAGALGAGLARAGDPQFSMGAQIQSTDTHPGSEAPLYLQLFDVMGKPHSVVINRNGKRFGDESYYVGINEAVRSFNTQKRQWENYPCFLILDEEYRQQYPLGPIPAGEAYPASISRAANLTELASMIGTNAEDLADTIQRFNGYATSGRDEEFGRGSSHFARRRYGDLNHQPNANLGTISKPPFYFLPLRPLGFGICSIGLTTDEHGRVLRYDKSNIEGLFATGNAVATTEFHGYITGYANSRNMAMAHASVQCMAEDETQI